MKKTLSLILSLVLVIGMLGTSVFTVSAADNTVKIGDVEYETLADALAAVGEGDVVIELIADAALDYGAREAYGTEATTSLTINGNGKTLTLNQTNSDWSSFGLKNAAAKLVLNNMTIEKTGHGDTSGAWNKHAINFKCPLEMNTVTVNNSISVTSGATLTDVTINEANGYYGLWISAHDQVVTLDGCEINATNGGRGIKIADQYIDEPEKVELNVSDTTFNTAKKAAVLVSSTAGAKITASNCDISDVAADSANFAWVDEKWSDHQANVEVFGANKVVEGAVPTYEVSVSAGDEGTVSLSKTYYEVGETVVLSITPATRHIVKEISVVDVFGNSVPVTGYSFEMPASAVTVRVVFQEVFPEFIKVGINASVELEGADLEAGEFFFQLSYLYNGEEIVIEKTKNAANGNVAFAPVAFNNVCNYTFFVKQIALDDAGVEYDKTVYEINAKAAWGADGYLDITLSDNNVEFVNIVK